MGKYKNVEIPFINIGNRQYLFEEQLQSTPWLKEFINAFPKCFEFDPLFIQS